MIILIYLIIAGVSVFCFCVGKELAEIEEDELSPFPSFTAPVLMGFFWVVGWVTYAPYLAAVWYLKNRKE